MNDPMNIYRGRYKEFIEDIKSGKIPNDTSVYSESHHIIPRCTFKDKNDSYRNSDDNKYLLEYRNHFIAHQILAHDNPHIPSLALAYWRMCNGKIKVATPEEYEEARSAYVEYQRTLMSTDVNPMKNPEYANRKSESMLGNQYALGMKHSRASKEKISNSLKGRVFSESTRKKISLSKLGNPSKLGLKDSDETREKKRKSLLGNLNGLGNKSNTGRIFINNGIINRTILSSEAIPEGWARGCLKRK